jgi:hypothetical protein
MSLIVSQLMALVSRAARKPEWRFAGEIAFTNLPPNFGMIVSLQLFPVSGADAPVPYEGDPPADADTDNTELCKPVDLHTENQQSTRIIPFSLKRAEGHYYVQVRAVLFRKSTTGADDAAPVVAQVEPFFFARSPLALLEDLDGLRLAIQWPSVAIEDMEYYATFRPGLPPIKER